MQNLLKLVSWILLFTGIYIAYEGAADYYQSFHAQGEQAAAWDAAAGVDRSKQTVESLTYPSLTEATAPSVPASYSEAGPAKGSSLAKLSIPRLDTVLYVLEGTDNLDLKRGPGHLEGTVMPGAEGNCVIAGHRDTHFRVLKNIQRNDLIVVQSREGTYRYRVSGMSVIAPDNTECLRPTSKAVLNLVTCFPFEYVGSAPRRFVVHADLMPSAASKS